MSVIGALPLLILGAVWTAFSQGTVLAKTDSISGVVLDATTDRPLAGVRISLRFTPNTTLEQMEQIPTAVTDLEGKFTVPDVPPGSYRLLTGIEGYAPAHADGRKTQEISGIPLNIRVGEPVKGLVIHLKRGSAIAGRIVDSQGRPLVNAKVSVGRLSFDDNGNRRFGNYSDILTNDRGEYRAFGLFEDDYIVYFPGRPNPSNESESEVPIFYPDVGDVDSAETVRITPGDEVRLRDVTIQSRMTFPVRLHIHNESGTIPSQFKVDVYKKDGDPVVGIRSTVLRDPFEMPQGLPHEKYDVTVGLVSGTKFTAVKTEVLYGEAPVDLQIAIRKGPRIVGQVSFQKPDGSLSPGSGVDTTINAGFDENITATSGADGMFVMENLPVGQFDLRFSGLPPDGYLISAQEGERNLLSHEMRIAEDTSINVVIGLSGGIIEGTAINSKGAKIIDATIALVPDDPHRSEMILYRATTSDQNGSFSIRGLAPGSYHLFAWQDLARNAYRNAEFMKKFEDSGTPIRIENDKAVSISLKILDEAIRTQN